MYIDETGNDDLKSSTNPNHRFLGLSGVILPEKKGPPALFGEFEKIKEKHFGGGVDDGVIADSPINLNKDETNLGKWDEEEIVAMSGRLAGLAIKVWGFPEITPDPLEHNRPRLPRWAAGPPIRLASMELMNR